MKKIFIFVFSAVVLCSFAAPKPQQDAELFEAKEKNMKAICHLGKNYYFGEENGKKRV